MEVLNLLIASNELGLHKLTQHVADFLIQHQTNFIRKDPIKMLEMIYSHDLFVNLREFCLEVLCSEPNILLGTDKFRLLSEEVLMELLNREDLSSSIKEITLWENIIEWGLGRNPTIDYDVNKWTKEDMNLMNNTIRKFIPLIQFHDISAEDFFNKVLPYEELLPKELKQEILRTHMLPGSRLSKIPNASPIMTPSRSIRRASETKVDSVIISLEHVLLFSSWIDRNPERYKTSPYEFNLLLRGSRDGMDPQILKLP